MRPLLLLALAVAVAASSDLPTYSAVCTGALPSPSCKFYTGIDASANSWAGFSNTINATGWADLRLHGVASASARA